MSSNLIIVSVLPDEVFAKDNTVLKPGADSLALAPGIQKVWYGQQVEKVRAYLAIGRDSLGDHKSFMAGEGTTDKVRGSLGPIIAKGAARDMIDAHFEVKGAPFCLLSAPEAELKDILTNLAAFLNESESTAVGGVFAPIVEKGG